MTPVKSATPLAELLVSAEGLWDDLSAAETRLAEGMADLIRTHKEEILERIRERCTEALSHKARVDGMEVIDSVLMRDVLKKGRPDEPLSQALLEQVFTAIEDLREEFLGQIRQEFGARLY